MESMSLEAVQTLVTLVGVLAVREGANVIDVLADGDPASPTAALVSS